MKQQLLKLKQIAFAIVIATSCTISAQESLDLTVEDCNANRFSTGGGTGLTCDSSGFVLTPSGSNNFMELRINGVEATNQSRVLINYTGSSQAYNLTMKANGAALTGDNSPVTIVGDGSVEFYTSDANFTGSIQLRPRFTLPGGDNLSSTTDGITITSLVVDDMTLSTDEVFLNANTIITFEDKQILVKNAPQGTSINIFDIQGKKVDSGSNLSSGIYIVKLSLENAVMTKKVIVF